MAVLYRHTQRATVILWSLVLTALLVAVVLALMIGPQAGWGLAIAIAPVLVVLGGTGWYFSSITVEVTENELRWYFGPGGYFRIPRSDIESVVPVRHPSFAGYGIRWMGPKRWTYRVSGRDTVEARLKSGGFTRLGTNDSDGLIAALTSNAKR
jgi:hypothetical protein